MNEKTYWLPCATCTTTTDHTEWASQPLLVCQVCGNAIGITDQQKTLSPFTHCNGEATIPAIEGDFLINDGGWIVARRRLDRTMYQEAFIKDGRPFDPSPLARFYGPLVETEPTAATGEPERYAIEINLVKVNSRGETVSTVYSLTTEEVSSSLHDMTEGANFVRESLGNVMYDHQSGLNLSDRYTGAPYVNPDDLE